MIKFGLKSFQPEFLTWSKHHKTLGLHVKRVYPNGEETLPKDENLRKLIIENGNLLKSKTVTLIDRKTNKFLEATDYYLNLNNLDYEEADLDFYSIEIYKKRFNYSNDLESILKNT